MKKNIIIAALTAILVVASILNANAQQAKKQVPNPDIERSNRINGQELPNKATRTMFEKRLLTVEQLDAKGRPTGMVLVTSRSVREKGTRSPIHVHPFGGQTCVVSGEMSLYLEGEKEILRAGPGDCYYMPAGRRMSGVNSADGVTIMIDTFVVPRGEQVWIVVEPGMEDAQDQFDKLFHTGKPTKGHH